MASMSTSLFPTSVMLQEFSRTATLNAITIRAPAVGKGKSVVMVLDSQNLFTDDVFVCVDVAGCRCLGGCFVGSVSGQRGVEGDLDLADQASVS